MRVQQAEAHGLREGHLLLHLHVDHVVDGVRDRLRLGVGDGRALVELDHQQPLLERVPDRHLTSGLLVAVQAVLLVEDAALDRLVHGQLGVGLRVDDGLDGVGPRLTQHLDGDEADVSPLLLRLTRRRVLDLMEQHKENVNRPNGTTQGERDST